MGFAYHCQVHADRRKRRITPIPDDCIVSTEYLNGLDNGVYVAAFAELQRVALCVYDDMIANPGEYGLKTTPLAEKEGAVNLVGRFGCLLAAIGCLGELRGHELVVPIQGFRDFMKKHAKYMHAMERLSRFGFVFTNTDGKRFAKGATGFTVAYPRHPEVIPALVGYAKAAERARAVVNPGLLMYMDDLYGCFFHRLIEDPSTQTHDPMFLVMTDGYSEEGRAIAHWLHDEAGRHGYRYSSTYSPIGNHVAFAKGSKGLMNFAEHPDTGVTHTKIILRKVLDQRMDLVYALPERHRAAFTESTCTGCGGAKSDKPCTMRIHYVYGGVEMKGCAYQSFRFEGLVLADMPQVFELALLEAGLK